jgi:Flp pilus assembly protein TadB
MVTVLLDAGIASAVTLAVCAALVPAHPFRPVRTERRNRASARPSGSSLAVRRDFVVAGLCGVATGLAAWSATANPAAALILAAGALTIPGALAGGRRARAEAGRDRDVQQFCAVLVDAQRVEPALVRALPAAASSAAPWLSGFVRATLAAHQAGAPLRQALRDAARPSGRRDLALVARLAGAAAELGSGGPETLSRLAEALRRRRELYLSRRAELAGHGIVVIIMLLMPVAACLVETGLPGARASLLHTGAGRVAVAFAAACEVGAWLTLRRLAHTEG